MFLAGLLVYMQHCNVDALPKHKGQQKHTGILASHGELNLGDLPMTWLHGLKALDW